MLWSFAVYASFSDIFSQWNVDATAFPMVLFVILMTYMFLPLPFFYYTARRWFLQTIVRLYSLMAHVQGRIILSPYHHVEFRDFFLTDELNSMVYALSSFQLFCCSYYYKFTDLGTFPRATSHTADQQCNLGGSWVTPFIAMLPAWWRFLQCWRRFRDTKLVFPHVVNGGKYFCSLTVTFLSATWNITELYPVRVLWILMSVIATCYSYAWGSSSISLSYPQIS
jgi:hypothetical protein